MCDKPILLSEGGKCPRCQEKKLSGLYFALSYKEKELAKKLIYQFKYAPYIKDLAQTLAGILAEHLFITGKNKEEIWKNSVLMPIPLDIKKLKSRGYNQSEELAKELSKIINVPVVLNNLVKTKYTKPQMELSKEERQKNLQGAFALKNPSEVEGLKIFLVDDVYTTGSTMEECANVLRTFKAKMVWGLALARES